MLPTLLIRIASLPDPVADPFLGPFIPRSAYSDVPLSPELPPIGRESGPSGRFTRVGATDSCVRFQPT